MSNSNKKVVIIVLLMVIELSVLFLMNKTLSNKNEELDEVKLIETESHRSFAIMLENSAGSGTYTESGSSTWPASGYTYNGTKSGCIDNNGNAVAGSLSFNNNVASISTASTVYCYLYFDKNA